VKVGKGLNNKKTYQKSSPFRPFSNLKKEIVTTSNFKNKYIEVMKEHIILEKGKTWKQTKYF
jgi:hypothetical protein